MYKKIVEHIETTFREKHPAYYILELPINNVEDFYTAKRKELFLFMELNHKYKFYKIREENCLKIVLSRI
jgi:hypothetical protein